MLYQSGRPGTTQKPRQHRRTRLFCAHLFSVFDFKQRRIAGRLLTQLMGRWCSNENERAQPAQWFYWNHANWNRANKLAHVINGNSARSLITLRRIWSVLLIALPDVSAAQEVILRITSPRIFFFFLRFRCEKVFVFFISDYLTVDVDPFLSIICLLLFLSLFQYCWGGRRRSISKRAIESFFCCSLHCVCRFALCCFLLAAVHMTPTMLARLFLGWCRRRTTKADDDWMAATTVFA